MSDSDASHRKGLRSTCPETDLSVVTTFILDVNCSEVEVWVTSSPLYVLSFSKNPTNYARAGLGSTDMGFSSVSSILISREYTGKCHSLLQQARRCSPDITGTSSERLWTASLALSYKQLQPLGGAISSQETVNLHVFRNWQCRHSYRRRYLQLSSDVG